ncbi:GNAT family N-acetyltransferase [Protaetiibacter mangrovi]|uniref:GNAT family N-acetyltransferase n=1 Tax=Protaetiibacter mangrovi TaxID=2970926 RepID=A0ABT1ZDF0_9MICO|nr:GNAT family N-acetyltransferase [Protaetiibacter mangrovi]MCS0498738.1 GNAT family N-acetyltransferase [Protaetiibacter mangrovi]TPX05573.1 GNAT family N-acetyltransferase [Schumannella luteola]
MADLRLEELTANTIVAARNLALKPGQAAFIAPETYEHVEQDLDPAGSWPRVVMDGDRLVGYVMGAFDPDAHEEFLKAALWRIHVEADAQGMGVGRFAVEALADEARRRGFHQLTVVWASGEAGPEEFFKAVGFRVVGETPYGENLGALAL